MDPHQGRVLRPAGWLLGPSPDHALWSLQQNLWALADAAWAALVTQAPKFGVIAILLMIVVLVDAGSIELITKRTNEPDQALTSAGLANLGCGLAGGLLATQVNDALPRGRELEGVRSSSL